MVVFGMVLEIGRACSKEFVSELINSFISEFGRNTTVEMSKSSVYSAVIKIFSSPPISNTIPKTTISVVIGCFAIIYVSTKASKSCFGSIPIDFHFAIILEQTKCVKKTESFAHSTTRDILHVHLGNPNKL